LDAQRPEALKRGRKNAKESTLQKPALVAAQIPKAKTTLKAPQEAVASSLGKETTGTASVVARVSEKARTIVHWIVTALFCLQMSFTAYAELRLPQVAEAFTHLGFPAWFRVELSWSKLLGVVLMLAPVPARLKEWAYAGLLWGLSYFFWRRLQATSAVQGIFAAFIDCHGGRMASQCHLVYARDLCRVHFRPVELM